MPNDKNNDSANIVSLYTVVLTKENVTFDGWHTDYNQIKDFVDVVWSDNCTKEEAYRHYDEIIKKQAVETKSLNSDKKWRVVRLYDANGVQLEQES